jgi:hypothetical protein
MKLSVLGSSNTASKNPTGKSNLINQNGVRKGARRAIPLEAST